MDSRRHGHVNPTTKDTRLATFIRERRCFTYGCREAAITLVQRHDGVEVPKCKGHAKVYGGLGCTSRPIAEVRA